MEWNIWALAAFLAVTSLISIKAQSDYGWGRWSDYTECSRTCGGGIQQTVRRCENGRCQGHSAFYRSCNTQECPEHSLDYRTAQCRSFNTARMEVKGITRRHSWRPYFDPSAPCALICQNEYGHVKRLRNTVVDGTHCDNGKAFGVCINGVCKPVGCDHRLGSFINEDKCLQCGGTGDGCRTVTGSTLRQRLNSGNRTVVATIPDGAMSLRIKLISTSPSALELMSEEGKRLRLTEATVSFGKHKIASYVGSLFTFTAMRDTMEFFARGPTNESMQLMVRFRGLSPLVEYEYSVKEDPRAEFGNEAQEVDLAQGRYRWMQGGWTPCSTECGPGYQLRAIKCVDNEMGQQASPSLCPRELMPRRNQTCNLRQCEAIIRQAYKWIPGHWGECNVECGVGEQEQLMHCIETGTSGKSIYADEELCTRYAGAKPKYERACRGESENCAEWTTGEWTECSVTCGYGRQTREVLCQRKDSWSRNALVTVADEECDDLDMPLTERLCHMGACTDGSNNLNRRRTRPTEVTTQPSTCRTSRYGCCRDGVTFARGRNDEGCPEEEFSTDLCQERSERGPCTNYTVKWYYDVNKKECLRFWYGGCEGNDNRFDDKPSCNNRCLNLKAKPAIDNCMTSRYGCCADGKTHAQGPDKDGCPERNLVGGCAGTRYGCCGDGQTSASGPGKFGCPETTLVGGCAGTRYGCCLDGKTAAAGENRYGCPEKYAGGCAGTRYGCCADKVTAARGEKQLGCPENPVIRCDMTEHGCCEDQQTAATGPDGEGCPESQMILETASGCKGSRYGCCPDGMTSAEGLNNEGCPSFDSAYCGMDKNPGTCFDYVLQWYFETKYGMCRQFWYGGCDGNQNRFGTKEECESKCLNVTGPARCRLPKVTGPCKASKTRYYFNARTGQCETFTYGGCKANSNNFITKSQCEVACNGVVSEEAGGNEMACARKPCQYGFECQDLSDGMYQCGCSQDWGKDCSQLPNYWCFSDDECASGFSCVRQKGCRGNSCHVYSRCSVDSRRQACDRARCPSNQDCVNDSTQREGYVCVDKVDYKRPQRIVLDCSVHEFGCCPDGRMPAHGPNNERCPDDCMTSDYGCCPDERTPATGPDFDGCEIEGSADMPCEKSDFGCCDDGIRAATGPRGEGCQDTTDAETTMQPTRQSTVKCTAAASRELCTKYEVKWRYDSKLMACERHWWGGCRDNGNVFDTAQECEAECITRVITEPTDEPDFVNICDMPSVVGPCRSSLPRYFYDPRERNCRLFYYGGCSGNENNFRTFEECQRECMADIRRPVTPSPTEAPQPTDAPAEATLMMSAPATVVEGEELRVTCVTTGPIGIRLEWFFNGQRVTDENIEITFDRKRITGGIEATGQLIISKATQLNSGTYYCRNTEVQTKSTSVTVQSRSEVTSPPATSKPFETSMTMSGQSVVYEGTELKIICRARGPSDVGLEWFINGQPVSDDKDVEVTTNIKRLSGGYEIIGELIIARAQMTNSGTYYCRSADRQLESMVVNVRRGTSVTARPTETTTATPTEKPDEATSSINMMGNARVTAGSTLSITCRAVGPRRPSSIEWFINGRYVNPRASIASISTSRDPRSPNAIIGTFSISNVNETNDGTYYCRSRPYGDIGRMSVKITDYVVVTERPSTFTTSTERPTFTTTTTTTTTEAPVQLSPAEVCQMSWDGGNCYASIPRWFYDHQEGTCTEMVYGGCDGNENNFQSEQECIGFCAARNICFQPKKIGMCRAAIPRFYFDTYTKQCKTFLYGGCDGNVNNFATLAACERKCADYLEDTTNVNIDDKDGEENVCELDPEKGSCRGYIIKWYYSSPRNRCARFVYTGCDGNANQFDSEEACQEKCLRTDVVRPTRRPSFTRRPTYFTRRPTYFTRRPAFTRRPTYPRTTTTTTTPAPTTTRSTTQSNVIPRQYSCNLPSDYGSCHDYKIKWYFNADDRRCLRFYYGGCGGNDNRFESRAECETVCVRGIVPTARPTTTTTTTERPYVYACTYSRFGCCNDGVTSAFDARRSNCPENQGGGSGGDSSSVLVPVGLDAVLVCPVRTGEITWYRDGFILMSDRRFQIYDNGTLVVRRVSSDMAGNYACRISNGNTIPRLERFTLSVNEPLSIVPGPALASVKPGEDAFLHCQALGNPAPRVNWDRNGRRIRSDSRHSVYANGTLIISETNFADEGEYVCSAENGVSQPVNRVITLTLRESIEADIASHQGIYMEGDTISLSCRGEGYPPPQIEWEKEGKMISGNNRITVAGEDLIVRSASIEDAGMYKCIATNERATATDFTTVQIKLQTPQGKCEDTMRHQKCHLIVTGRLCGFRMFANKCCKSCRRAGYV